MTYRLVLADLALGTASTHGYTAFFKTNNNLDAVRQVYQSMVDGPNILTSWNGNLSDPSARWSAPTIICANPNEPDTALQYASCISSEQAIMRVGGVARNTGIISLCPIFFRLPRIARRSACPAVENNVFATNGLNLARTQYAILVHELAHIYNPGTLVAEEKYKIQETVELDAEGSFENAQNWADYAAGEFAELDTRLWGLTYWNSCSGGVYGVSCSGAFGRLVFVFVFGERC